MSREFLRTGAEAFHRGDMFAARFNGLHALELAVKACLLHATGEVPRTHNVAGEFARRFRAEVGADFCRKLSRSLDAYSASRYPDAPHVAAKKVEEELDLAQQLLDHIAPQLLKGSS